MVMDIYKVYRIFDQVKVFRGKSPDKVTTIVLVIAYFFFYTLLSYF